MDNKYCLERIEITKRLINKNIDFINDEVIAVFICSSVGRGDSDENLDIDLHLVYKEYG